jgi:dihydrofolate synthase/folylpolyglutamate synthase
MTYRQAIQYLQSLEKFGINLGLARITALLGKLGDPHFRFKSIHITGTNGKGSTAAMIASILNEAGFKVGLYTSPHLIDYRERIKINGGNISETDFESGLELVRKISDQLADKPTVFEVLTAVAFWYFAKQKVDFAVVEVGMGGRLDATNVIVPLVSIITNIDYEHTAVLGKTLSKIAGEKAAIIKPGVPVVTAETKAEPLRVIKKVCEKNNSLLIAVSSRQSAVSSRLIGEHQRVNAACAISAIRLAGINVSSRDIARGLKEVNWPGRFQIVSKKPLLIIDGAHNPAGATVLKVTIEKMFARKFVMIFGCQRDKDYKKVIRILKPIISAVIVTRSSHLQAADPRDIIKYFIAQKIPAESTGSVKEALSKWNRVEPLIVTGSLFVVADTLKHLDADLKP